VQAMMQLIWSLALSGTENTRKKPLQDVRPFEFSRREPSQGLSSERTQHQADSAVRSTRCRAWGLWDGVREP